jgi:hypothetical protein
VKITEQSVVSLGLCVVLCGVSWRTSKIESKAEAASVLAAGIREDISALNRFLNDRRDLNDERLEKINEAINQLRVDVASLKRGLLGR